MATPAPRRRLFLTLSTGTSPTETTEILRTEHRGAIDAALVQIGAEMRVDLPDEFNEPEPERKRRGSR